jgi:hypothetical protein
MLRLHQLVIVEKQSGGVAAMEEGVVKYGKGGEKVTNSKASQHGKFIAAVLFHVATWVNLPLVTNEL